MLQPILVIAAIVAAVLVVLYMLTRRFPMIGEALAFLCVFVARVFVKVQGMLEKAGSYCYTVFSKTLNYPPNVTSDTWHGVLVIARNIILAVSSIVITGDIENMLLSVPLLFGGGSATPPDSSTTSSPGNSSGVSFSGIFTIPTSLLFVAMSMLFGAILLECLESIPYGAGLFPKMTNTVRKLLIVVSSIGVVLSLVFAVVFWVYRGWYLVDAESAGVLSIPVFALAGLLVIGSSVFSLWGMVVGLVGFCTVAFWCLSTVFHLAASCVSVVPSLFDVLALHFTQGTMSVYGDFLGHDPYKAPRSPFPASRLSLPGQKTMVLLPQNASTIVDADGAQIVPIETNELEELTMSNPNKNAGFGFVAEYASSEKPHVQRALSRPYASDCVLTSFHLDLSKTTKQTGLPDTVDLSPTVEPIVATIRGVTLEQAYTLRLNTTGEMLVEIYQKIKSAPFPLFLFIDRTRIVSAIEMIESVTSRLRLSALAVVTTLSERDLQDKGVQTGLADLYGLWEENKIETTFITSPLSDFAKAHQLETQHRFTADFVVNLLRAHRDSPNNPSCVSVLQKLHPVSPFTGLSFATEAVAIGDVPLRYRPVTWLPGIKGHAGVGNFSDTIAQTRVAIQRDFTDEKTRAFPAPISDPASCIILCTAPYGVNNERYHAAGAENENYVANTFPHATCITVSGNGSVYPYHTGSRFVVTATCCYPVHATSLLRPLHEQSVKVTQLHPLPATPEPSSTNSHVPALPKQVAKRAVASSRQKNTTPARQVGRKSVKQAK